MVFMDAQVPIYPLPAGESLAILQAMIAFCAAMMGFLYLTRRPKGGGS